MIAKGATCCIVETDERYVQRRKTKLACGLFLAQVISMLLRCVQINDSSLLANMYIPILHSSCRLTQS